MKPRLLTEDINLQVRKASIRGKQNIDQTDFIPPTLTPKEQKNFERARISQDQFIAMTQFADMGNRIAGKRQLKLNFPELREAMLSNALERGVNPLTDRAGLSRGGKVGMGDKLELLDIRETLFSIQNDNKLADNPNPSSFKITM